MKRPPDTESFTFHNENPQGRKTGDCVFRALALAMGKPWGFILTALTERALQTGYSPNGKDNYTEYLALNGWEKQPQPRKASGRKYTGAEFCQLMKERGIRRAVLHIGGHHIAALCNGTIHDIWNCSGRCVGNYWIPNGGGR